MTEKFTTPGFADYFVRQRKHTNTFLDTIHQIIDFREIEKLLRKNYKNRASADGRPAYPPLPMFKLLLLQRWYGLSDPGTEEALKDRISFIRFTGFSFQSPLPDYSTICRFRNTLLDENLYESLFAEVNRQLEERNLLVKGVNGAIVDATIIESSRRPRKVIEIMPEDRKEEKTEVPPSVTYFDDAGAAWIKDPIMGTKPTSVLMQKTAMSWEDMLPLPILPIRQSLKSSSTNRCFLKVQSSLPIKDTQARTTGLSLRRRNSKTALGQKPPGINPLALPSVLSTGSSVP